MDRVPDQETMRLIGKHISFLKKKFAPKRIVLFGSRARGDNLKESDIDLLVVSEKFSNIPFRERMIEAYGMWDKKQDLEQICYTPVELKEMGKRIGIVKTALSEGIDIN